MQKIESFNQVLEYLKDKTILTTNGKNIFIMKEEKIFSRQEGSTYSLKIEDFIDLFKDTIFYIYEDDGVYIDDHKDEDYYRYYKK